MKKLVLPILISLLFFNTSRVFAQWVPTSFNQSVWNMARAGNGNLVVADDIYPLMGGLHLSEDEGETWTTTMAGDFAYTANVVKDESLYFGGVGANVAISHDNGITWNNVNFSHLFSGITDQDPIYAMEYHNGRIYASVLNLGVAYSNDEGVTWKLTDVESLWDANNPENGGQWTYNLRSFNGKLYNIGAFGIWVYDEAADLWSNVDNTWYGGYSIIVDDVFYVSYNASGIPAAIRYTTDFQNWQVMPIPNGMNTSVRILEYYQGAFFMGHVNDAVYYTIDHGVNWTAYREDFPKFSPVPGLDLYGVPMNMVFSGETMICGVFSSFPDVGGVFKAPIPAEIMNVNDIAASQKVSVYPNPAKDNISFKFPQGKNTKADLKITDALGRIISTESIDNSIDQAHSISVDSWPRGLYFYSINNVDFTQSGKFLVE